MMTIIELRCEIKKVKSELSNCVMNDNYSEIPRLITALSVLKDTLLECYSQSDTKNIICPVVRSDINVVKYIPPDFTAPLSIVK